MVQKKETHQFGAETGKILQLMIHSLYTNKDIFLRELVSNASDALDKLRYEAVTTPSLLADGAYLAIDISTDEKAGTLTIADNGIGMNKEELIENLGTIARSGTQHFMEAMTGDSKADMQLIGQFGVGFYASFMVADHVKVISKKAGDKEAWQWESDGSGGYSIEPAKDAPEHSGTSITLTIKKDAQEFLDKHRIRHIIKTYSDHISFPVTFTTGEEEAETLNEGAALWARKKSEITKEQYQEFYKHIAHAGDEPWMILHNQVEGTLSYTNLLFIPTHRPFDLFHPDRQTRVKLFVKRVFIAESSQNQLELLPAYLRFVQGVVDTEDLPLNISRETLQHNHLVHKIKNNLAKKVLSELKKKAEKDPEAFDTFWQNFGAVLKEGLCEGNDTNRELLMEVCRFQTSKSDGKTISLDEYIANMKDKQSEIFYITGESVEQIQNSPQLEGFKKRDIEVLFLTDSVDDFWLATNHEYKGKEFNSVTRSNLDLDAIAPAKEDAKTDKKETEDKVIDESIDKAADFFKEVLGSKVLHVSISKKLDDSPVCLAIQDGAMDMRMERFLLNQKQLAVASPKILEINPHHPAIQYIAKDIGSDTSKELIELLYDQACIIEGETITDTGAFAKRLNHFLQKALVA
jgi:molecular chaperone HtpG